MHFSPTCPGSLPSVLWSVRQRACNIQLETAVIRPWSKDHKHTGVLQYTQVSMYNSYLLTSSLTLQRRKPVRAMYDGRQQEKGRAWLTAHCSVCGLEKPIHLLSLDVFFILNLLTLKNDTHSPILVLLGFSWRIPQLLTLTLSQLTPKPCPKPNSYPSLKSMH